MFDNCPTNIQEYPCPSHPQERVTHVCSNLKCLESPYLCQQCFCEGSSRQLHSNHEESLMLVSQCIKDLAVRIDASRVQMHRLHQSTMSRRDQEQLLKKLQQSGQHNRMSDHINHLKLQVEKESEQLQLEFQRRLQSTKQTMFQQLDTYLQAYSSNMEGFRSLIDPLVSFERKLKYMSNPNCLSMRMLAELKRRSVEGMIDLKRTLNGTVRLLAQKQSNTAEMVNRASTQIQSMIDDLPLLRVFQNNQVKSLRIQAFINEQFHDRLVVREVKPVVLDAHDPIKLQSVLTPTSTATSGLSSHRQISHLSRSPLPIEERQYNRTLTDLNSGSANVNRTVIRTNRLS